MAIAEVVILLIWVIRRTRRSAIALLAPALLAGAVVLTAKLVKTDKEQITQALHEIAASAQGGRLRAARGYLDPACRMDLDGQPIGRREMIALGEGLLKRHRVEVVGIAALEITVAGRQAAATLTTIVTLAGAGRFALGWETDWARRQEGWRIVEVRPVEPEILKM